MSRRRDEVGQAVAAAEAKGWTLVFVTLTIQHHERQALGMLWDGLSKAWGSVTGDAGWRGGRPRKDGTHAIGDKERYSVEGFVRAVEVTHGVNGWHPHVHALVFCSEPLSDDGAAALGASMFGRWQKALKRADLDAKIVLDDDGEATAGLRVRRVTGAQAMEQLGDYVTKSVYGGGSVPVYSTEQLVSAEARQASGDIAAEVTMGALTKSTKSAKGRTPFGLLRSIVETGDMDDVDLWREWERASKGRQQLTWSAGLRDILAVAPEQTDEEIVAEEVGTEDDTVLVLTREGWETLRDSEKESHLLGLVERHGAQAAALWLDVHRVAWRLPGDPVGSSSPTG